MEEEEFLKLKQEREEQWEKTYIRRKEAAAELLRYFAEKKFTVDDARDILDITGRWVTAATTVNADETAISELMRW